MYEAGIKKGRKIGSRGGQSYRLPHAFAVGVRHINSRTPHVYSNMTGILTALQVKKQSLREVHELAQSHTATEWQIRNEIQPDSARLQ